MSDSDFRDDDVRQFGSFVAASRWQFAKTYVETYPHEYTVERWGDADAFWKAILCIERWGVPEAFWHAERKYLYVDEQKYWHMGNPSSGKVDERPELINRTWLDVARYDENARQLGYDDANTGRLVARWKQLLEKARQGR